MKKSDESQELNASMKRFADLQKLRRGSVSANIARKRSMIIINMLIEIFSGLIYIIGVFIIIRFLNMKKSQMLPIHFRLFMGVLTVISCGWFVYLFIMVRSHYKRLRESFKQKRH